MVKLGAGIGAFVASTVTGIVTARFGFMTSFLLSTVAGGFGMYYGAKIGRKYAP